MFWLSCVRHHSILCFTGFEWLAALLLSMLETPDGEHGQGPHNGGKASSQEGRAVVAARVVDKSGHGGPHSERDGAEGEEEPYGLPSPCGTTKVEGDGSQHCDEAAVKYAQNKTEDQQGLKQRES